MGQHQGIGRDQRLGLPAGKRLLGEHQGQPREQLLIEELRLTAERLLREVAAHMALAKVGKAAVGRRELGDAHL